MKKILLALLLVNQIYSYSQSKNSITFKIQYNPETKYSNTIEQTSYNEITYSGSKEFLRSLKDKGIENPTITNKSSKMETLFKTGKSTDGKNFPLTIEIVTTSSSDGKKDIPDGLLLYGHGSMGAMPTLDSVVSEGINEELKKTLLQTMQSMFSQLDLPERQVKVGEKFSIETPLNIPVAGVTLEMIITTTYKLLSVNNGVADFDVVNVYTMKTTITKYTINATGSGKGKLLYDIANNYYVNYQTDTKMDMSMKLDNFNIDLKTKSGFSQTSVISKNTGN
ncbi:hypothetical protein CNR22_16100 [Sphingobacteriaceae bacterium]|nr:hypothetical protein CNR22_16100 [Sphingobacteriaceae bacterium]